MPLEGKDKKASKESEYVKYCNACLSATLSNTNPTLLDPVLNPGRRGGKPATNRLSYGVAQSLFTVRTIRNTNTLGAECKAFFFFFCVACGKKF
jgi:hypothetical protein